MKKIYLLMVLSLIYCAAFSQIGISTPQYAGKDANLIKSRGSEQFQLFLPLKFKIFKDKKTKINLSIQPGIKWEWYNFKNNLMVERRDGYTSFVADSNLNHIYKNRLFKSKSQMKSSSFYLPISVILRTKQLPHFEFSPGIYTEYLLGGKFKRRFTDNDSPKYIVNKFKDDNSFYDFKRFQYGLSGSISYRFITFYGVYSLTKLFKPDEGINVREFTLGIWLSFF